MTKFFVGPAPMFLPQEYQMSTPEECLDYCARLPVLAVDTETTGLNIVMDKVIMLQVGDEHRQYAIDVRSVSPAFLKPILEGTGTLKVFANAKFDVNMLRTSFGFQVENVFDVILAERILHTGRNMLFSLSQILLRRFGVTLSKELRGALVAKGSQPFTEAEIVYGLNDIAYLVPLARAQWKECSELNLLNVLDLENEATLAFADIEFTGIGLDTGEWIELAKEAQVEQLKIRDELDKLVLSNPKLQAFVKKELQADLFIPAEDLRKVDINWASPTKVLKVFQRLIPTLEGVNSQMDLAPHKGKFDLIDRYVAYKEYSKLTTSYGESFITQYLQPDGKIHTSFFQILDTGRVSSKDPNMQQIPADNKYRNCFVPTTPGWKFVSSDFSSQELCLIAHGSQDPIWLQALRDGKDLHSVCAEVVFGDKWKDAAESNCAYYQVIEEDKIAQAKCKCPKHNKLRTFVKTINFGLAYGMTEHKLSGQLQISLEEASELIDRYFTIFPKIRAFLRDLGNFAIKHGYITTMPPYLRRRWFDEWNPGMSFKVKGEIERAGKNTPIQGSGADMTKKAMCLIRREIRNRKLPVRLVMVVHDQIDTEAAPWYAEEWSHRMTELMEQAALEIVPSGLLKSDTEISDVWKK